MVPRSTQDLRAARAQASFSAQAMSNLLCEGGRLDSETKQQIMKVVSEETDFDKSKMLYMSRGERLERGLRMTKKLFDLTDREDWGYMEYMEALMALDEPVGLNLHEIAFQPVIQAQGSDEQHEVWMPKCLNHEIIGCYMQTELGHGSNVQQLETTSTYDVKTKEFVINSPTVSATKWWIGALGLLSTHGVVQARLILNGKDMGPHLFIIQLRSLEDHSLMPNIEAGEIGPKVHGGMAAVDNGWARFNNVRIPHDQMLSRFAKVNPDDGTYSKPPHDKIAFGGMVFIRAQMIGNLAWKLSKAVTISTRYLHCRRQFANPELKKGDDGFGVERQVITYPGVYMRILPLIAKSYVFLTAGKDMAELYGTMAAELAQGNTTLLAETHAVSSGLKSYVSTAVVEGIEVARRACGGHGFMGVTGIGSVYANELPSVTYEGDNYILVLQVARAALKSLGAVRADSKYELSPSSAYLGALTAKPSLPFKNLSGADWLTPAIQLQLISLRAALAVDRLDRLVKSGKAWSELSHECIAVSSAVVEAFLVRRMQEALGSDDGLLRQGAGEAERKVLSKLINFYILYTLESALPQLLEFGILAPTPASQGDSNLSTGPIETLREQIRTLAKDLLPEMVGLVDAFAFSDWDLNSELGKYDGGAYESLLARAKKDLDANVGDEAARKKMYDEHIKPILERGKRLSKM